MKSSLIGSVLCSRDGKKVADIIECKDGLFAYHDYRRHITPKVRYGTLAGAVVAASKSLDGAIVQIGETELSQFVIRDYPR